MCLPLLPPLANDESSVRSVRKNGENKTKRNDKSENLYGSTTPLVRGSASKNKNRKIARRLTYIKRLK